MMWRHRRRKNSKYFDQARLLESATAGVCFEMRFRAEWYNGKKIHHDLDALIATSITNRARPIAMGHHADDLQSAQDAINALVGVVDVASEPYCSALIARVELRLSPEAEQGAAEYRRARAHVERLLYLKKMLYSDPALLAIDHLDRHPELATNIDMAAFQRLAVSLASSDRWWHPLLSTLENLGAKISDQNGSYWAMRALLAALQEGAPEVVDEEGLREIADKLTKLPHAETSDDLTRLQKLSWSAPEHDLDQEGTKGGSAK
ncbi:hypothetical protein ACWDR9_13910 [Streptosporangium sandarakinum]|uniref:hypothetical protein n=1 Tax=Streptosporangium sandarakinum TaxID=1260955 RepID=UPI00378F7D6F